MSPPVESDDFRLDPELVLADPSASFWLRAAVREALARDPVDALNDALALAQVLDSHLRRQLDLDR
jgi:hypothetical protein